MVLLADTRIRSGCATQSNVGISRRLGLKGRERRLCQTGGAALAAMRHLEELMAQATPALSFP
jgi:hypothetical protein